MTYPPVIPITMDMLNAQVSGEPRPVIRKMVRGDTLQIAPQVVNEFTRGSVDVTGWTFWFTAKYALPNPDKQAAMAQDNISSGGNGGITLVQPTLGQALVQVQPSVTLQYPDGPVCLDYDIQAKDPSGVVTTVEFGKLTVWPDVTRSVSGPS